jgi:ankyrin repeat protein
MSAKAPPIHEYAKDGNFEGLFDELARGTHVDLRNPINGFTPLMEAASSPEASVESIRLLIKNGANVNAVAVGPHGHEVSVLRLAVRTGKLNTIQTLLDCGANVHYSRPHGYDVVIDAVYGAEASQLIPILQLLIERGANLNGETDYCESALSVTSNGGRFDAVRILLNAGANAAPLQWNPLMHSIALGSLEDVKTQLKRGGDLSARDFWTRTPWLLSLQVGEVQKAKLLLAAGADRSDRGRCGKRPLMYPIINGHTEMLLWLLSEGFDPNDTDEFGETPLMLASEMGATECAKILVAAGADIHRLKHSEPAIKIATNLDIVRLLVNGGADLNDISDEMRASLTKLPSDGKFHVSQDEFQAQKHRRFGNSNPEKMNFAFWKAMTTGGKDAYAARKHFDDIDIEDEPIWCFKRFGKSINELPDGRIIEIAGEHEDHYDPDFCIYNDVIVHHGNGTFDIYGYPKATFPPTDFHSATLVEKHIYIVGSLGYTGERKYGETQVYRLNIESFEIEKVETSGQKPGWINRHKVIYRGDGRIQISGGKVCAIKNGAEEYNDNSNSYVLDLGNFVWSRVI